MLREDVGGGSGSSFTVRLLPISWLFRETLSHTLSHLHQQISIPRPQEEIGLGWAITQQMLTSRGRYTLLEEKHEAKVMTKSGQNCIDLSQ